MAVAINERGEWLVESLGRGLRVIRAFDADHSSLRISEVSERTGLSRAACRRLLLTLVHEGYAGLDGDRFHLNAPILDLGFSYLSSMRFPDLAQPILRSLVQRFQEAASIAILDGTETIHIARATAEEALSLNLPIGTRLPAYATSLGRILLSDISESDLTIRMSNVKMQKFTPVSITRMKDFIAELRAIRDKGWASTANQFKLGLGGVAVPIRDKNGIMRAALNIHRVVASDAKTLDPSKYLPCMNKSAHQLSTIIQSCKF